MSGVIIKDTSGLDTHGNDLSAKVGSTSVADNVDFGREGRPERRRGFKNYSTNLPDFRPEQLIASAAQDQAYLHLDSGIWYHDGSNWLRKRGAFGTSINNPTFAAYSAGHLYVCSSSAIILDINLSTGSRTTLAGRFGVTGSTNGTGGAARFNQPFGICTDGTNLFVCDQGTHIIRKIVISSGAVTTLAGTAGVTGSADGTGAAAEFNTPYGICTDNTNLYVCDSANHTIRKIVISSGVVTTLAGTAGASGSTNDTGSAARFNTPAGIATDNTNLYVCDAGHTIRKIVISSAVVTTLAGTAGAQATTDGTGSAARFDVPYGIGIDSANLYVSQNGGPRIRKIVISSAAVTTIAGGGTSGTDGIGTASGFASAPQGVVSDGVDIYICDYNNDVLRKLYTATTYVSTIDGVLATNPGSTGLPYANGIFAGPD